MTAREGHPTLKHGGVAGIGARRAADVEIGLLPSESVNPPDRVIRSVM